MTTTIQKQTSGLWTVDLADSRYHDFGEKYFDDPAGFVQDCLLWDATKDEHPTFYQLEIMEALVKHKRACARGPHGLGKSALSSWIVIWFSLTRDALMLDWKVPTTASAWRQLTKYLWPEIHKWLRRVNWSVVGRDEPKLKDELSSRALALKYGQAFAVASNRSELIEGAHADHILYLFDESKVIPDPTWDSAEGAMVSDNSLWLSVSTPGGPSGRFYEIQTRQPGYNDWWVRHVTLQEAVDAGRISTKWANERLEQWGEESAMYQNRVLGNFAQEEQDVLIPLHWVEAAMERYYELADKDWGELTQLGLDVARMGGDKTVLAERYGTLIAPLQKYGKIDTMRSAGLVVPYLRRSPSLAVMIDVVGLGAGVYDRVTEELPDATRIGAFHPQTKTDFRDASGLWEFSDTYSAAWWNLRELLDPGNPRKLPRLLALPPDEDLPAELTAPKWKILSSGKIQIERKEDVKERLGRSPDSADAVVMAAWEEDNGGMEYA